jgi:hypothetical protein
MSGARTAPAVRDLRRGNSPCPAARLADDLDGAAKGSSLIDGFTAAMRNSVAKQHWGLRQRCACSAAEQRGYLRASNQRVPVAWFVRALVPPPLLKSARALVTGTRSDHKLAVFLAIRGSAVKPAGCKLATLGREFRAGMAGAGMYLNAYLYFNACLYLRACFDQIGRTPTGRLAPRG